jgi:DNA-directed RNA polymerase specialized sigma24 family protein
MQQDNANDRLSRITTLWTLVLQAHAGPTDAATAAQCLLMQRYCGAVYRYLLGALKNEEAAADLFQDFAVRFLRGDFRRADPQRGRFRNYVKTALINLVNDYRNAPRLQPLPENLATPPDPICECEQSESTFIESWREEMVSRTWAALAETHSNLFTVLMCHVRAPDVPAQQKAEQLAAELEKPFTANQFRVTLHRAREKFAELLVEEVRHSLESPSDAELEQELRDLHLLSLCESALQRHRG